jgi:hypothetical protein
MGGARSAPVKVNPSREAASGRRVTPTTGAVVLKKQPPRLRSGLEDRLGSGDGLMGLGAVHVHDVTLRGRAADRW